MRNAYRQRSNLPANRELNRALSVHRPSSFGIRRPLEKDSAAHVVSTMDRLQIEGNVPENIRLRDEPCVTLLPKRVLGRQMAQGIVLGYRLSQASAKFEHDQKLSSSTPNVLRVEIGRAAVYKGYAVYLEVISDKLELERQRMFEILGSIGFKGAHRSLDKPLHVTLGNSADRMSRTTERDVTRVVQDAFEPGIVLDLLPWDPYSVADELSEVSEQYDVA